MKEKTNKNSDLKVDCFEEKEKANIFLSNEESNDLDDNNNKKEISLFPNKVEKLKPSQFSWDGVGVNEIIKIPERYSGVVKKQNEIMENY